MDDRIVVELRDLVTRSARVQLLLSAVNDRLEALDRKVDRLLDDSRAIREKLDGAR